MAEIMTAVPEFLVNKLRDQYGEVETSKIIKGYSAKRPVTLRLNPLKGNVLETKAALEASGIRPKPVEWYKDAFILTEASEDDISRLKEYEDGKIYLQSLSSMLPPLIMAPTAQTDILDMAAAPGGKTTQMAALAGNGCRITACELNGIRAQRLKFNVARQGASCVFVMQTDSRSLDPLFSFDSVLLDAPCSGSGTLSTVLPSEGRFTTQLVEKSVKAQKTLISKAMELLKPGHTMVYSTCSVLKDENEDIVAYAVKNCGAEVVPIDVNDFPGVPLLENSLKGTLTVCPDGLYEGFFAAKLMKTASGVKNHTINNYKPMRKHR